MKNLGVLNLEPYNFFNLQYSNIADFILIGNYIAD